MSVLETLRAVAAGRRADLLADCRFEGFGTAAYGPDAIAALFAHHPFSIAATPHVVATAGAVALFDTGYDGAPMALVADVTDRRVARLWRIGPHAAAEPAEAAVSVPFDTDMHQLSVPVLLAATDHPWLDAAAVPAMLTIAADVAAAGGSSRSRTLCLRAFSDGTRGAALLYRYAPPDRDPRLPSGSYVAAHFGWQGTQLTQAQWLVDAPTTVAWTPRL